MLINRKTLLCCVAALVVLALAGCGKKADENRPIADVKAEAEKMDTGQLQAMATRYKQALEAKTTELDKIMAKLKEIPITKQLGGEAEALKADIDDLNKSVSALKERFQIYYDKLKEKGGDLSGLEI